LADPILPDLILHQYAASPFSEKIRAIFGFKKLAWRAVEIPNILPKPDVVALTGGYRRTPVLQIGADIYCDTELIARTLDAHAPAPPLYPARYAGTAVPLAQWADSVLFLASAVLFSQREVLEELFAGHEAARQAFIADRVAMRKGAPGRRPTAIEARLIVEQFARRFDAQLAQGSRWLVGDAPTIADFAAFHALWFVGRSPGVKTLLTQFPNVARWMQSIEALGHGTSQPLSAPDAVDIARAATPAAIISSSDSADLAPGTPVEVVPTDYAFDPVAGTLVRLDAETIAVRRIDTRAGELIVHFPRLGFEVRKPG
jgi:glutathione S-transferase